MKFSHSVYVFQLCPASSSRSAYVLQPYPGWVPSLYASLPTARLPFASKPVFPLHRWLRLGLVEL